MLGVGLNQEEHSHLESRTGDCLKPISRLLLQLGGEPETLMVETQAWQAGGGPTTRSHMSQDRVGQGIKSRLTLCLKAEHVYRSNFCFGK